MRRGKYEVSYVPKYHTSKKALAMLLSLALVIGCVVGGTLAWLMTSTDPVTNTFSTSNIQIELKETLLDDTHPTGNSYKLIPGKTYAKDPLVTVKSTTDVDCWLFFKLEANNPGNFLTYELNLDGWTELTTGTGIYYRAVTASNADQSWYLLKGTTGFSDGYVTVSDDLTLNDMSTADDAELKFTAYAIQKEGFADPADAWAELNP